MMAAMQGGSVHNASRPALFQAGSLARYATRHTAFRIAIPGSSPGLFSLGRRLSESLAQGSVRLLPRTTAHARRPSSSKAGYGGALMLRWTRAAIGALPMRRARATCEADIAAPFLALVVEVFASAGSGRSARCLRWRNTF